MNEELKQFSDDEIMEIMREFIANITCDMSDLPQLEFKDKAIDKNFWNLG